MHALISEFTVLHDYYKSFVFFCRTMSLRFYNCILCSKRTKPNDRRKLDGQNNKSLRKFLQQKFFVEPSKISDANSVICNRCRQRSYKEISAKTSLVQTGEIGNSSDCNYVPPSKYIRSTPGKSPPSITLPSP